MKPYYQDEWVQIYLGDCREILPQLPKVDLVLTDPPYNAQNIGPNQRVYEGTIMKLPDDEYKAFCLGWFELSVSQSETIVFTPEHSRTHAGLLWHCPLWPSSLSPGLKRSQSTIL